MINVTPTAPNTPPPIAGGGWGVGCVHPDTGAVRTPPPNPLPQGEGEYRRYVP